MVQLIDIPEDDTLLKIFEKLLKEHSLQPLNVAKVSYANGMKCCSWNDFAEVAKTIKKFQFDNAYGTFTNTCDTSICLVGANWHSRLNINHLDEYYNHLSIEYDYEGNESYQKPSAADLTGEP